MARKKTEADLEARIHAVLKLAFPGFLIYLLSTGVSFCGDVGVAPELRGSGRIRDPNQLIPMIKMVIMAQIHMKIFKPFDRAIRETLCLKLIVINLFR
jgi:hypothetical protein